MDPLPLSGLIWVARSGYLSRSGPQVPRRGQVRRLRLAGLMANLNQCRRGITNSCIAHRPADSFHFEMERVDDCGVRPQGTLGASK